MHKLNKQDNEIGRALLHNSITIDPYFTRAHAALSFGYWQSCNLHYDPSPMNFALARQYADRSMELDCLDPFSHLSLSRVYWLDVKLDESLQYAIWDIALNPNYDHSFFTAGRELQLVDNADMGEQMLSTALRLNPLGSMSYITRVALTTVCVKKAEYVDAIAHAEKAIFQSPNFSGELLLATVAHHHSGNSEIANYRAGRLMASNPEFTLSRYFNRLTFSSVDVCKKMVDALRA